MRFHEVYQIGNAFLIFKINFMGLCVFLVQFFLLLIKCFDLSKGKKTF